MRSALLLLASVGVAWGQPHAQPQSQLGPSDQSFIDALGVGSSDPAGGGGETLSPADQGFLDAALGGGNSGGGGSEYPTCEGGTKSCVPYYLCENNNVVTDGAGIIDIRFGANQEQSLNQHSECKDQYTSVCCTDPLVKPTEPLINPTNPDYQPVCGRRNAFGINARIVGIKSNEAQFGEWPWMAAVLTEDAGKLVFLCGASLISPNVLVTAAHCVYGLERLVVRLGEWDTQHTTEFDIHMDYDVAKVVVHEEYNHERKNLHNDVALLFLNENVVLKAHIDTICLPEPQSQPVYGADCFATGWGKNSFKEGQFQLILKQVTLPLIHHDTCQAQMQQTRLGGRFLLHPGFLCAGGNGADTCTGDGGSPLVCPDPSNPGRYVLRGIVSWGIGCGTANVPGVYVDVTYFSKWIFKNM